MTTSYPTTTGRGRDIWKKSCEWSISASSLVIFYANKDITFGVRKRGGPHTAWRKRRRAKSTLMNVLVGLYQPTEGKILINDKPVRIESPAQAVRLGIGMVHQHFMLVEAMTVLQNIILGDTRDKGLFIHHDDRKKRDRRAVTKIWTGCRPGRKDYRYLCRCATAR